MRWRTWPTTPRLLRELDTGPVIWVGLSMGGMVGQKLALRHPALVRALVLANTTSSYLEAARAEWEQRIATVRASGIEATAEAVMGRYFHDGFCVAKAATVARFRRRLVTTDAVGYVGCCDAVGKVDNAVRLGQIAVPALVIAGDLDQGTPVAMAQALKDAIPAAPLDVLQDASHLSAAEQPQGFAALATGFVAGL